MYFIINQNTREVIRKSNTPFNIDETIQPPPPLIQLKRINNETIPTYDEATEKIMQSFVDDDVAFTRTFFYEAVEMTTEEKAAYQQRQVDIAEREAARNAIATLENPATTAAQWRNVATAVIKRLVKDALQN